MKRVTTEKFIEKAILVHGNKYDYSKVEYVNSRTKICIICPEHGEFWQTPNSHSSGKQNCPECTGKLKYTKETFITASQCIYGDKYDYSNVIYINNKTKVHIICSQHGSFLKRPNKFLRGKGCPSCGKETGIKNKTSNSPQFIEKAIVIHGDRYDYHNVKYKGCYEKVCIICPTHGEFWQQPNNHLTGNMCPECVGRKRYTTTEFIDKAGSIHTDKYDYSKTIYINAKTKICIICPDHGEFWQRPYSHLHGHGCFICNSSKGEIIVRKLLQDRSLNFTEQHRFSDCRNILPLPFDFYLPELNLCIEYDGIQHFEPLPFFGGVEGFLQIQLHDKIKTAYCENHGIRLIRIRYDEDIEEKLSSDLL